MSGFQLNQPFTSGGGYRPPANLLGDYHLQLDPTLFSTARGWMGISGGSAIDLTLPQRFEDQLAPFVASLSRNAGQPAANPLNAATAYLQANPELVGFLAELVRDKAQDSFWGQITVAGRRNVFTGDAVTIGVRDPAGRANYAGVDETIGKSVDSAWLGKAGLGSGTVSLGRRFGFSSGLDVSLLIYRDSDALKGGPANRLLTGGGLNFTSKLSSGDSISLKLGAGRDQAGGPAGFLLFEISSGN